MQCLDYMVKRGFKAETLTSAGMRYTYDKNYPLIFPILDNGEFKGWVSRTNKPEIEKSRKYLYNKGFSRRDTLCGKYSKNIPLVVVEGYMDKLKLNQFGLKNVVAILGWKATREQISKIYSVSPSCIICALDNDECGKKGYEYLKKFFPVIRWSYLKGVKDCGEMTQQSFEKMYLRTKRKVIEYKNNLKRS